MIGYRMLAMVSLLGYRKAKCWKILGRGGDLEMGVQGSV